MENLRNEFPEIQGKATSEKTKNIVICYYVIYVTSYVTASYQIYSFYFSIILDSIIYKLLNEIWYCITETFI